MAKKLVRLTESDLHRIIKKSSNRIINEIGDTAKGQYMLGRLSVRHNEPECGNNCFGDETPITDYAEDARWKSKYHDKYSNSDKTAFNMGRGDEQGSRSIVPDLENKYRHKHGLPIKECDLHRIIKASVNNVLKEHTNFDYNLHNPDDMFQQIWNIYFEWGKSKGYRENDMYNVPTFLMLIDVAHINKECNYLVNQYLDEVGGINTLVEKEMARLKEKYITQYLGTLQEVHHYYNEPKGWYQGEPYWDGFPGPDVSSWN